jgi:hypothetical protein
VDQQATRRARTDPRATFDPGRLSGSQGVTPSLKVTVAQRLLSTVGFSSPS